MAGNAHFPCFKKQFYIFLILFFSACLLHPEAVLARARNEISPAVSSITAEEISELPSSQYPTAALVNVIATRLPAFKTRLSETSGNPAYLDAEGLNQRQPRTFQDAVQYEEGVVLSDAVGNGIDRSFSMRGFSNSNSVVFLLDGVRINEIDQNEINFPLIQMNDIESILIERGSGSTMYGSNAFAGVVHLTTRQPSERPFSMFGGAEWSSYKGVRFHQGFSGTITDRWTPLEGRIKYYFNGGRNLNKGFRSNGEWRITNFDVKTGYELADETAGFMIGVKHNDTAVSNPGELTIPLYHGDPFQSIKPLDGRDYNNTIIQVDAYKKFWDERVKASLLASYRRNQIHFFTTYATQADYPDDGFNPNTDKVTIRSRSADLVWQLAYQDQWNWLGNRTEAGMEFRDAAEHSMREDTVGGVVQPTQVENDRRAEQQNAALFWREELSFFERLFAHVGMRHQWDIVRTRDYASVNADLNEHWRQSTVSTGVTYQPAAQADLFFNYAQGFRSPSFSDIAPYTGSTVMNLKPEESDSYEIGTRVRPVRGLEGSFSYFLIDVENEILYDANQMKTLNIGKSRRYGIETSVLYEPFEEFHTYGTYTWTKAYVREGGTDWNGSPFDDSDLGLVPRNRFTFGVSSKPFHRTGCFLSPLEVRLDTIVTGSQRPSNYETTSRNILDATSHRVKPYIVSNFTARYPFKGVQVYLKVNNIFDERYYSRAIASSNSQFLGSNLVPAGNHFFVTPGAPREFVIGVSYEFGN